VKLYSAAPLEDLAKKVHTSLRYIALAMAPIHEAAGQGDLDEVMRLIKKDPGVAASTDKTSRRWSALHFASHYGHVEVTCYLLDQGADINAGGNLGQTPFFMACREGRLGVVELLISRGADITIHTKTYRHTPLMVAASRGHVAVVGYLLRIQAVRATSIIDTRSSRVRTALWLAAANGHVEVVKLLVEAGANPMIASNDSIAPMDVAQQYGHHQCIELLQVSSRLDKLVVLVCVTPPLCRSSSPSPPFLPPLFYTASSGPVASYPPYDEAPVEVMMVLEGKQPWARALRDRRSEQGLLLPLPSVGFMMIMVMVVMML